MSKIITDKEFFQVLTDSKKEFLDELEYQGFLAELAEVATKYFGGQLGTISYNKYDELGTNMAVEIDERVPNGGGVWAKYDTDVKWVNGVETD